MALRRGHGCCDRSVHWLWPHHLPPFRILSNTFSAIPWCTGFRMALRRGKGRGLALATPFPPFRSRPESSPRPSWRCSGAPASAWPCDEAWAVVIGQGTGSGHTHSPLSILCRILTTAFSAMPKRTSFGLTQLPRRCPPSLHLVRCPAPQCRSHHAGHGSRSPCPNFGPAHLWAGPMTCNGRDAC